MNFDFSTPYSSARLPQFARNIVSTSHPLAAQAGLRMMLKGGNAVDAAIAAAAAALMLSANGRWQAASSVAGSRLSGSARGYAGASGSRTRGRTNVFAHPDDAHPAMGT